VDFEDREALEEFLSEKRNRRVEIRTPQRGQKKTSAGPGGDQCKHSFDARFRVLKPSSKVIQESLQDALNLPDAPRRSSASTSHTFRAPNKSSRAWWCGRTAR